MERLTNMKSSFKHSATRIFALAGLLLCTGAYAQTKPVTATPVAQKKCLLWKAISGNNIVYLLGSIHLGSKNMYPLPKVIEFAYSRAKTLVVEVDIDNLDQSAAMGFITAKGMYQGDDNLWKHVSKETADKIKKYVAKYTTPNSTPIADSLGMFKPWVASVELAMLPMQKAGMDASLGIDKYFLDRAHAAKPPKKIEQVETADFQLKLLSSLPDSLADEFLNFTIGEADTSKDQDSQIEKLWINGDAEELDKVISETPKDLEGIQRAMREDRNPHMTDVAEKYLKGGGPCFFVVGAAHLIGKEGVIALLKKRGYTVFQVAAE